MVDDVANDTRRVRALIHALADEVRHIRQETVIERSNNANIPL